MNKKNHIIISAIVLAAVAGGAFYGGMLFSQGKNKGPGNFSGNGGVSIRGNRQGGMTAGEIISKDDKSVTIKLINGGSKIVFYSTTTEIGKFASGTIDDLAVGKSVSVNGSSNSDGSVTAQSIQIRPAQ